MAREGSRGRGTVGLCEMTGVLQKELASVDCGVLHRSSR
jgi:hypothetical protein